MRNTYVLPVRGPGLRNLTREITSGERDLVCGLLAGLDRDLADFRMPGLIDIK